MTKLTTCVNWDDYPVEIINCVQWNELVNTAAALAISPRNSFGPAAENISASLNVYELANMAITTIFKL